MVSKPSENLAWGNAGVSPGTSKKTTGYLTDEIVPQTWFNWFHSLVSQWELYLEERTDNFYQETAVTVNTYAELTALATALQNKYLEGDLTVTVGAGVVGVPGVGTALTFSNIFGKATFDFSANSSFFRLAFDNINQLIINDVNLGDPSTSTDDRLNISNVSNFNITYGDVYSSLVLSYITNSSGIIETVNFIRPSASSAFVNNAIQCTNSKVTIKESTIGAGVTAPPTGIYLITGDDGSDIRIDGTSHIANATGYVGFVSASSIGVGPNDGIVTGVEFR